MPKLLEPYPHHDGVLEVVGIASDAPERGIVAVQVRSCLAEDGGACRPQVARLALARDALEDGFQVVDAHADGVVVVRVVRFRLHLRLERCEDFLVFFAGGRGVVAEMEADGGVGDDPEFLDTVDPRVVRGTDYPDGEIETPGALAEVADEHFFGRFLVRYGLERVACCREEDRRRVGLAGGDGRVDREDVLEVAVAAEVPVDPCEKRLGRDGLQDMQQDRREAREDHRTPVQEFGGEEAVAFLYGEQQGAHVQQEGILVRIQVLDGGRYEYRDFRLQLLGQIGVPRRREVGAPFDALHLREFIGGWRCRARVVHDAGFAPGEGVDGCRLGRLDLDVEDILCHCRPPC